MVVGFTTTCNHYKNKKYIRRKNLFHKKAKKTNTIGQWKIFRKIRNNLMLNASNHILIKCLKKINTETNGSKNWWNLVKSLLHSDSGGDQSIPPLQVENGTRR